MDPLSFQTLWLKNKFPCRPSSFVQCNLTLLLFFQDRETDENFGFQFWFPEVTWHKPISIVPLYCFDKKLTASHPKGYRGSKLKANGYEKSTLYLVIRINTLESTCPWYMSSHQRYCVRSIWALNDCLMDDQLGTDLVGGRQRQNAIMIFFA